MVTINEQMGFRPVEVSAEFVKRQREADRLARPHLGAAPQVVGVHERDHRVATGRRVVGQQHHRLAVRRAPAPRPAPCPRWAARRPAPLQPWPLEPQADPVRAARPRRTTVAAIRASASGANQSARGPGSTRSGPATAAGAVSSGRRAAPRARRPAARRRGDARRPDPGQGVGRPRAQHRLAPRCPRPRRGSCARPARRPEPQHAPRRAATRRGPCRVARPSTADRHGAAPRSPPPRCRHRCRTRQPTQVISSSAASTPLPTSRLARPAAGRSSGPARGTPRCAQPSRPRSWTVVSGPAASTLRPHVMRPEPHPGARCEQRGSLGRRVPQRHVGAAEQLPPTGRGGRVDAAPRPARATEPGRHPGPRGLEPRHGVPLGQPAQVGEARREPAERRDQLAVCGPAPRRRPRPTARRPRRGPRRPGPPAPPPARRRSAATSGVHAASAAARSASPHPALSPSKSTVGRPGRSRRPRGGRSGRRRQRAGRGRRRRPRPARPRARTDAARGRARAAVCDTEVSRGVHPHRIAGRRAIGDRWWAEKGEGLLTV